MMYVGVSTFDLIFWSSQDVYELRWCPTIPVNIRHWPDVGPVLGQRRGRRPNIGPTSGQCLVFTGIPPSNPRLPTISQSIWLFTDKNVTTSVHNYILLWLLTSFCDQNILNLYLKENIFYAKYLLYENLSWCERMMQATYQDAKFTLISSRSLPICFTPRNESAPCHTIFSLMWKLYIYIIFS